MLHERETRIGKVYNRLNDLPSLPKVVERLLRLSDSGASTREFADLIATDQGLSAKVLKLVNSAFYSLRSPISSIRHASSLLGVRTLKSLALSVSVIQIFKRSLPGFDPIRFWRHALSCALAGRKVSEHVGLPFQDEVYIVGLLHDTGMALMIQHFPQDFARIAGGAPPAPAGKPAAPPPQAVPAAAPVPGPAAGAASVAAGQTFPEGSPQELGLEREAFGQHHPEVGFNLATHWRLPPLVGAGIRWHHASAEELPPDLEPDARRLIGVIQFADFYARRSGHSFAEFDRIDPAAPLPDLSHLGLVTADLGTLVGDLEQSVSEMELLFLDTKPQPVKG